MSSKKNTRLLVPITNPELVELFKSWQPSVRSAFVERALVAYQSDPRGQEVIEFQGLLSGEKRRLSLDLADDVSEPHTKKKPGAVRSVVKPSGKASYKLLDGPSKLIGSL